MRMLAIECGEGQQEETGPQTNRAQGAGVLTNCPGYLEISKMLGWRVEGE
jgi:hypothetical protein